MRSINKVILIGNLTRDPELRKTQNGQSITTFGIATNREWVTRDGDRKNSAEFHECVAWAHLAEICDSQLNTGDLIYIEGYLKTRNWEDDNGEKKYKTEIVVQEMIIVDRKNPRSNNSDSKVDNNQESKSENNSSKTEEISESPLDKDLGL